MSQQFTTPFRARDFGPEVPRANAITFSTDDLAHALFVTGRAPGDRTSHGSASVWEFLHRTSIIPAYIRRAPNNRLTRSALAVELDRSEKVALSYAMGQAMTGIFSEKVLSVAFLMHIDRYATRYNVAFGQTRKRADLFGKIQSSGWVVAEAKGRSGPMESDLERKLIAQKRSVRTIAGAPPDIAYGCVAHFPPVGNNRPPELKINAFDPLEDEIEAIDINVDIDRFIQAYYEPFLTAIELGERDDEDGEDSIIASRYSQFGLRVGMMRRIYDRVREARFGQLGGLYEAVSLILSEMDSESLPQFLDGTIMETQWASSVNLDDYYEYRKW